MPSASGCRTLLTAASLTLALASCAHRKPAPVAEVAAPIPPRPVLSAAYDSIVVPPIGSDGHYQTINDGIGEQQTIWHVRAALNVAAIGCRGPEGAGLIAAYNTLLKSKKAVLAKANRAVEAQFRAEGAGWQDAHDQYMTRLYNFFSMPQASAPFCATAATVAAHAVETDAASFPAFAQTALLELEAPFVAVYQTIDTYKVQLAAWDARYGPGAPRTAIAQAPLATPQLRYADAAGVLAWEPGAMQAMALR